MRAPRKIRAVAGEAGVLSLADWGEGTDAASEANLFSLQRFVAAQRIFQTENDGDVKRRRFREMSKTGYTRF